MTAREFLTKYNELNGYPTHEESLIESLVELGKIVHREGRDVRRWYIKERVVKELDGVYIQYTDYILTGDNNASDMGLEYDLDEAIIVERKERQVTEVYYSSCE